MQRCSQNMNMNCSLIDCDFCTVSNHGFATQQREPSLSVLPPVRMGLELPQRLHDLSQDKAEGHHKFIEFLQPFSAVNDTLKNHFLCI